MTDRPRAVRVPAYLAWLRTLPCTWCKAAAPSECSHHGPHGIATKASDLRAIPLCGPRGCHAHYHKHGTLPGSHMDGEQTAGWASERALDLHDVWLTRAR